MISALRNDTRIIAPLSEKETVREYSQAGELYCPVCRQSVIFRAGDQKIWHFAHRAGSSSCSISEDADYRPETQEHQVAKTLIYYWLNEKFPSHKVEIEEYVHDTNQFADVLLRTPEGTIAFELQYSRLTGEEWRKRSTLYNSAGIVDVWLLIGKNYAAPIQENEANQSTVPLSSLAKAILKKRGQVYFLDIEAIGEEVKASRFASASLVEKVADEALLVSANGIADHYEVDETSLQTYLNELNNRPLEDQHPWFSRLSPSGNDPALLYPWSEKDIQGRSFTLQPRYVYEASLKDVSINSDVHSNPPNGRQHRPVLLASPRQDEAAQKAWAWEIANYRWRAGHSARVYRRKIQTTKRSRYKKMLVGRGVASALPKLYPELLRLASKGREDLSETQLRKHPGIPKPVRKWSTANWSPLTDIELPLEWVFGCHRQLWQMVVYCYCFCHKYIRSHLSKHGLNPGVTGRVFTGFAMKAIASELREEWQRMKPTDRLFSKLNRWVDEKMLSEGDMSDPSSCRINTHTLRYIVISLYFDRLCEVGLLSNRVTTERTELANRIVLYLKQLRPLVQSAATTRPSPAQQLLIGERWLELAQAIRAHGESAKENHYSLRVPFVYPFGTDREIRLMTRALRAGDLGACRTFPLVFAIFAGKITIA